MTIAQIAVTSDIQDAEEALRIFRAQTGLRIRYCRQVINGWVFYLTSEEELELVTSPTVIAALAKDGIVVGKVPEYKAESTVVARHIPEEFRNISGIKLARFISIYNSVEIFSVTFNSRDSIDIELDSPEDASLLLNAPGGMILGPDTRITDLERKPFSKVSQCRRCYSFSHDAPNCTSPGQVCFYCGEQGHSGNECNMEFMCCANCQGYHVAFASKCPTRKEQEEKLQRREEPMQASTTSGLCFDGFQDDRELGAEREVNRFMGIDRMFPHETSQPTMGTSIAQNVLGQASSRCSSDSFRLPFGSSKYRRCDSEPVGSGDPTSPRGATGLFEDPLPVSPRRSSDPPRPSSRLENYIETPIMRPRPYPRGPRRTSRVSTGASAEPAAGASNAWPLPTPLQASPTRRNRPPKRSEASPAPLDLEHLEAQLRKLELQLGEESSSSNE